MYVNEYLNKFAVEYSTGERLSNVGKRLLRGPCENPMGLFVCDCPMETVEYIWVYIWCMVDWILPQNCRNTLPLHTVDQLARSAKNETLLWLARIL